MTIALVALSSTVRDVLCDSSRQLRRKVFGRAWSNVIVERWNGVPFVEPYKKVRDVVRFLRDALSGEKVAKKYDTFEVNGFKLGVRPEQTPPILVAALREGHQAVVPGLPVIDTIKEVEGDLVVATLDRSRLVAVQTPQGFRRELLLRRNGRSLGGSPVSAPVEDAHRQGAHPAWRRRRNQRARAGRPGRSQPLGRLPARRSRPPGPAPAREAQAQQESARA